ncbi:hypothetical protein ACQP3J_33495, partial [Escherichia coli]
HPQTSTDVTFSTTVANLSALWPQVSGTLGPLIVAWESLVTKVYSVSVAALDNPHYLCYLYIAYL